MNLQEAYINGFVKRASQYGLSQYDAINLLKQASDPAASALGPGNDAVIQAGKDAVKNIGQTAKNVGSTNVQAMGQNVSPGSMNDRIAQGVSNVWNKMTAPTPAEAPAKKYVPPTDPAVINNMRQYASNNTTRSPKVPSPDEMLRGIEAVNNHMRQLDLARQANPSAAGIQIAGEEP